MSAVTAMDDDRARDDRRLDGLIAEAEQIVADAATGGERLVPRCPGPEDTKARTA